MKLSSLAELFLHLSTSKEKSDGDKVFNPKFYHVFKTISGDNEGDKLEEGVIDCIIDFYQHLSFEINESRSGHNARETLSTIWEKQIFSTGLGKLVEAIKLKNKESVRFLLRNFWCVENGSIGATYTNSAVSYRGKLRAAIENRKIYKKYKWITGGDIDKAAILSKVGNPFGFLYNNKLINEITIRHALDSYQIHKLIEGVDDPVILEIGGGHGSLAGRVSNETQNVSYIDCDLPEMLLVAFYYLRNSFPDKRVFFISTKKESEDLQHIVRQNDIVLLPSIWKESLKAVNFDVTFNSYSLSEMSSSDAGQYLKIIESNCNKWFLHENHYGNMDTHSDAGLLNSKLFEINGFQNVFKALPIDERSVDCVRSLYVKK